MKNKDIIIFFTGVLLIINAYEFYARYGIYFYPTSTDYNVTLYHAEIYTSIVDILLITGSVMIGFLIYRTIKNKFNIPKLRHFYPITFVYAIILAIVGGLIHIMPSRAYSYPHVVIFSFGQPMFTPNLMVYYANVIGIYIYPFQVLSLITASIIGGSIVSISFMNLQSKSKSTASLIGAVGVCPACATGTFFGLVIGASPFLSSFYLNYLYGSTFNEIFLSLTSLTALFLVFIYFIRRYRTKFIAHESY